MFVGLKDRKLKVTDARSRQARVSTERFNGTESEALLILLDQEGICASSGGPTPAIGETLTVGAPHPRGDGPSI